MTLLQRDREIRKEGREEGRREGRREGSTRMAALTKILLSENRMEELERALEDSDYRDELFVKYNI